MSRYEEYIVELEGTTPSNEAVDAAIEALAFVENLNQLLLENGADIPEDPDVDRIGLVLDGVFGELAAASIFLSEKVFARVPDMLRAVADSLATADEAFVGPDGESGPSVPSVVVQGYRDLAARLEFSRKQRVQLIGDLQKFLGEQDNKK